MDESNAGAGSLLAGAAIPALSAWSSFSCSQRCPPASLCCICMCSCWQHCKDKWTKTSCSFTLMVGAKIYLADKIKAEFWAWSFCVELGFTSCRLPKLQAHPFHKFRPTNSGNSSWEHAHILQKCSLVWFFLPSNYIRGRNEVKDEIAIRNNARVQKKWNKWGK